MVVDSKSVSSLGHRLAAQHSIEALRRLRYGGQPIAKFRVCLGCDQCVIGLGRALIGCLIGAGLTVVARLGYISATVPPLSATTSPSPTVFMMERSFCVAM